VAEQVEVIHRVGEPEERAGGERFVVLKTRVGDEREAA
jgi:hypothetical protein